MSTKESINKLNKVIKCLQEEIVERINDILVSNVKNSAILQNEISEIFRIIINRNSNQFFFL